MYSETREGLQQGIKKTETYFYSKKITKKLFLYYKFSFMLLKNTVKRYKRYVTNIRK